MRKQNKKVLVIRCGLLGDTVDATSVIEPLLEYFGKNTEIYWVSKPGVSELFKYDSRVTKVYSLKHTKLPFYLNIGKCKIILDSFIKPFDLILNLEIGTKFNDIVSLSKSYYKIGMPYEFISDDIFKEHRVKHQLRILDKFCNNYSKDKAIPSIVGEPIHNIRNKFPLQNEYIVMCPTNSHVDNNNHRGYRSWPIENWRGLIKKIVNETKLNIILVGNSDEKQYFKSFEDLIDNHRTYNLCGNTSISELISIMASSSHVIATDSGSVHVAGASAKRIISIHGPTNYYQSAPFETKNNQVKIATLDLPCSPCYDTEVIRKCRKNICMQDLSSEQVFDILRSF